jgi:hypothetical protein
VCHISGSGVWTGVYIGILLGYDGLALTNEDLPESYMSYQESERFMRLDSWLFTRDKFMHHCKCGLHLIMEDNLHKLRVKE